MTDCILLNKENITFEGKGGAQKIPKGGRWANRRLV